MPTTTLWLATLLLVGGPPASGENHASPATAAPRQIVCRDCLLSLVDEVRVPARRAGQMVRLIHREGDEVTRGQLLAQMDDRDAVARESIAKLELAIASHQAASRTRYEAAVRSQRLEDWERTATAQLVKSRAISEQDHQRESTEAELAEIHVRETKNDLAELALTRQLRQSQLALATVELNDRRVLAPRAGVIAEVFHHEGDWIEPEEPILRIVRMDRLRVEAFLRADELPPHEALGRRVNVRVELGRGTATAMENCRIDFVSPELESDGQYRIWVEIANVRHRGPAGAGAWILRPGMTAEICVPLDEPVTTPLAIQLSSR